MVQQSCSTLHLHCQPSLTLHLACFLPGPVTISVKPRFVFQALTGQAAPHDYIGMRFLGWVVKGAPQAGNDGTPGLLATVSLERVQEPSTSKCYKTHRKTTTSSHAANAACTQPVTAGTPTSAHIPTQAHARDTQPCLQEISCFSDEQPAS